MKRTEWLFFGVVSGILLSLCIPWIGATLAPTTASAGAGASVAATAAERPSGLALSGTPTPASAAESDERAPASFSAGPASLSALPTPIPGETLVYFVPADSDATGTVLVLYNTDAVSHIVALRGYSYNGVLGYSLNITVGATSFVRLSSDSIAAAPPPSWATPAPVITNFTDFTYLASLSLPKGVKVEGYTVFNPGTGVIDPRLDQGAIPLRFSTDPLQVFLPSAQRAQ